MAAGPAHRRPVRCPPEARAACRAGPSAPSAPEPRRQDRHERGDVLGGGRSTTGTGPQRSVRWPGVCAGSAV